MGQTSNLAAVLGTCFAGVTLIGSLVIMGFSAAIAAYDHSSKIGIVHLVVSLLTLFMIALWCVLCCATSDTDARQAFGAIVMIVSMFMYIGAAIVLGVDATSRPDYLAGQAQFFNKSMQEYGVNNVLSEHPYYGIFFFNILIIVFGFVSLPPTLSISFMITTPVSAPASLFLGSELVVYSCSAMMIRAARVPKLMTSVQPAEYMSMDSAFTTFLKLSLNIFWNRQHMSAPQTYVESVISFLVPGGDTL